jgi:hypothetical protein
MGKWFIVKGSEYIGPFTDEAVKSMYDSGMLHSNSVLWSEEHGRRDQLSAFDIFNDTLENAPPQVEQKFKKEVVAPPKKCPYCNRSIDYEDNICALCSFELMAKAEKQEALKNDNNSNKRAVDKPEKKRIFNYVIAVFVIAITLFFVVASLDTTREPEEPPLPLPRSGVISTNFSSATAVSPFEIISKGSDSFYIKVYYYGTERLAATAFLRGGESIEFDVPLGSYELRWATGKDWYGPTKHFGPKANRYKANDVFRFTETYGWTVELFLTTGGTLERIPIDEEDF